ncbi:hypothetical protein NUW54_g13118 [Trametes sanguinea]|uniref:Uncharacterized protein n=1 Tax=Trametes sanguinea TaxID=158606 RepID=A0ACC1MRC5_9APHY|nr:hypothetical protein NUW54_g13118 [Trametes sanguinea]
MSKRPVLNLAVDAPDNGSLEAYRVNACSRMLDHTSEGRGFSAGWVGRRGRRRKVPGLRANGRGFSQTASCAATVVLIVAIEMERFRAYWLVRESHEDGGERRRWWSVPQLPPSAQSSPSSHPPALPPHASPPRQHASAPPLPSAPHTSAPNQDPTTATVTTRPAELTPQVVSRVQKHCRYAISALDYEDAEQAIKELRTALRMLGG